MKKTIDIPDELAEKMQIEAIKKKPKTTFKKYVEEVVINSREAKNLMQQ